MFCFAGSRYVHLSPGLKKFLQLIGIFTKDQGNFLYHCSIETYMYNVEAYIVSCTYSTKCFIMALMEDESLIRHICTYVHHCQNQEYFCCQYFGHANKFITYKNTTIPGVIAKETLHTKCYNHLINIPICKFLEGANNFLVSHCLKCFTQKCCKECGLINGIDVFQTVERNIMECRIEREIDSLWRASQ